MFLKGHIFTITLFKYITKDRQDKNYKCSQTVQSGLYIIKNIIIRITYIQKSYYNCIDLKI